MENLNSSEEMASLSQVINQLKLKKLDNELVWKEGRLSSHERMFNPEDLRIVKTFRFEGDSNPDDSSVLYVLQSRDGFTGYCLDSFGMYADHPGGEDFDNFLRQVKMNGREDQLSFEL